MDRKPWGFETTERLNGDLMLVSLEGAATTTMLVKNAIYHDYW